MRIKEALGMWTRKEPHKFRHILPFYAGALLCFAQMVWLEVFSKWG